MLSFTSSSMVSFSYLNMFKIVALRSRSLLMLTFEPSQGQFLLPAFLSVYGHSLLFICMCHKFLMEVGQVCM